MVPMTRVEDLCWIPSSFGQELAWIDESHSVPGIIVLLPSGAPDHLEHPYRLKERHSWAPDGQKEITP
jgi:hypothetical protein